MSCLSSTVSVKSKTRALSSLCSATPSLAPKCKQVSTWVGLGQCVIYASRSDFTRLTDENSSDKIMIEHPSRRYIGYAEPAVSLANGVQSVKQLLEEVPASPRPYDNVEILDVILVSHINALSRMA